MACSTGQGRETLESMTGAIAIIQDKSNPRSAKGPVTSVTGVTVPFQDFQKNAERRVFRPPCSGRLAG